MAINWSLKLGNLKTVVTSMKGQEGKCGPEGEWWVWKVVIVSRWENMVALRTNWVTIGCREEILRSIRMSKQQSKEST